MTTFWLRLLTVRSRERITILSSVLFTSFCLTISLACRRLRAHRYFLMRPLSFVQSKPKRNRCPNCNRFAFEPGRRKSPLQDSRDCSFIENCGIGSHHNRFCDFSVLAYKTLDPYSTFYFGMPGLIRVLGLNLLDRYWLRVDCHKIIGLGNRHAFIESSINRSNLDEVFYAVENISRRNS